MKRDANHIKETNSLAYINKIWAEWSVNKLENDYGTDLEITVFENNESTNTNFSAQLKSTDKLKIKNDSVTYSIDTEHLEYFFNQPRPFLFVLYDNINESAYWLIVQNYIWDNLNQKKPNWRKQKTNTLYLPIKNKIENKDHVKTSIEDTQNRIFQERWFKLKVGEGLGLNESLEDIEKLERFEENAELKTKEVKLILANKFTYQGNTEKAVKKIMDIYKQEKKDLMHIKSIISLTSYLNISNFEQNQKCVNLCLEGIEIAKELDNTTFEALLTIIKTKAEYFTLTEKVGSLLYSKKISSKFEFGQLRVIFIDEQYKELTKLFIKLNKELDQALETFVENKEHYLLVYSLTEILDIYTMTIPNLKIFNNDKTILKEEIENKEKLADHLVNISKIFKDKELELHIKSSLASFYYITENSEAINLIKDSLTIAKELKNVPEIRRLENLLQMIKERPNPYKVEENWQKNLNPEKYQNVLKESLKYQGIDLNSANDITKAILLGLKDANPEKYFKFCKNLYIAYLSSSPLAKMVGIPTLGSKMVYCPYGGQIEGISLEDLFKFFKDKYCNDCNKKRPRDHDWKCKVGWIEEMRLSDTIQGLLKKRYENKNRIKLK